MDGIEDGALIREKPGSAADETAYARSLDASMVLLSQDIRVVVASCVFGALVFASRLPTELPTTSAEKAIFGAYIAAVPVGGYLVFA